MPVSNAALRKASRRTSSEGRLSASRAPLRTMVPSVSVPVLSVHRMSMLPRFSIASRRRTMTPRRPMARAPADRVTLMIAGNSSGDRPTASATANRSDSITGRPRSRFTVRTNRTMTTITRIRRYPNWRTPRAKSVSGWRALSRAAIAPNAVRQTGFDDEDLRRAALDRGAEKDCIGPSRKGRLRLYDPRLLLDRKGLARHARFADQEVLRLDHEAIGRDQIACRKQDEIAGHDSAHGHRPLDAVPHDTASQRQAAFQLLDRRRRPVLLKEAEQRASEHDRQNDGRVHPLLQHQRDRSGEDEDEDERALELPQKQTKRAQARRVFNAVGADQAKLRGGFLRRKAAGARSQCGPQRGGVLAPVGGIKVWTTHFRSDL